VSLVDSLTRRPLRLALGGLHRLLRAGWLVPRKRASGVHAVAVTPSSTIVLVKLRYAPGWRLPGGGRKEHEDAREAVLRELREEIGMTSHGEVQLVADLEESADFKRGTASLFIVRGVEYSPRWSWEVEAVTEAPIDGLPRSLPARTSRWLALVRPYL